MAGTANTRFATAVHALALLAAAGEGSNTSGYLASSAGVSAVYMRRVLGTLRQAGLVSSRPGAGGGWRLCVAPEQLPLDRIWRAVDRPDGVLGLNIPNPACATGQAIGQRLAEVDARAARAVEGELAGLNLAGLLGAVPAPDRPLASR